MRNPSRVSSFRPPSQARATGRCSQRTLGLEHDLCKGTATRGESVRLAQEVAGAAESSEEGKADSRPMKAAKKPAVEMRRVRRKPGCENLYGRAQFGGVEGGEVSESSCAEGGAGGEGRRDAHRAQAEAAVRHLAAARRRAGERRLLARRTSAEGQRWTDDSEWLAGVLREASGARDVGNE